MKTKQTLGEQRVRKSFNPSEHSTVKEIKERVEELIVKKLVERVQNYGRK